MRLRGLRAETDWRVGWTAAVESGNIMRMQSTLKGNVKGPTPRELATTALVQIVANPDSPRLDVIDAAKVLLEDDRRCRGILA